MNTDATGASAHDPELSDAALWDLETRFWQGDERFYDAALAPAALMVFPDPTGILDRDAILASIRGAPRWTQVDMTARRVVRPHADVAIAAYRFSARQDDDHAYRGWASSSYTRTDGVWSMSHHQQTPTG
jgi:hypothetical protein